MKGTDALFAREKNVVCGVVIIECLFMVSAESRETKSLDYTGYNIAVSLFGVRPSVGFLRCDAAT